MYILIIYSGLSYHLLGSRYLYSSSEAAPDIRYGSCHSPPIRWDAGHGSPTKYTSLQVVEMVFVPYYRTLRAFALPSLDSYPIQRRRTDQEDCHFICHICWLRKRTTIFFPKNLLKSNIPSA